MLCCLSNVWSKSFFLLYLETSAGLGKFLKTWAFRFVPIFSRFKFIETDIRGFSQVSKQKLYNFFSIILIIFSAVYIIQALLIQTDDYGPCWAHCITLCNAKSLLEHFIIRTNLVGIPPFPLRILNQVDCTVLCTLEFGQKGLPFVRIEIKVNRQSRANPRTFHHTWTREQINSNTCPTKTKVLSMPTWNTRIFHKSNVLSV